MNPSTIFFMYGNEIVTHDTQGSTYSAVDLTSRLRTPPCIGIANVVNHTSGLRLSTREIE